MSVFGDRSLTVRVSFALVLANARYWSTIAPLVHKQLGYWTQRAKNIPDPLLRDVALANLCEEGFNAQATATLATLAPLKYRKSVVEAIVGLQVIYDYLDSLVERPLADPLRDGDRLYAALVDAIVLDRQPRGDYYPQTYESDDDGYLAELISVVRRALVRLPSQPAIADASRDAAERCAQAQIHAHATSLLGTAQLELWAKNNAIGTGLQWRDFLAGAVSSGLALHALIAIASGQHVSQEQALDVSEVYLAMCALTTLLDGLIDYEQDMRVTGHPGYVRYYDDLGELSQGLGNLTYRAASRARNMPHGTHHLMTVVGIAAYYMSAPTASSDFVRPTIEQAHDELRPLITPTLAIMHAWRYAKRARRALRP